MPRLQLHRGLAFCMPHTPHGVIMGLCWDLISPPLIPYWGLLLRDLLASWLSPGSLSPPKGKDLSTSFFHSWQRDISNHVDYEMFQLSPTPLCPRSTTASAVPL